MNANIVKAISSETRIKILSQIGKGEVCACKLPSIVKKTQPAVSQHLGVLKQTGLVRSRRDGAMILYSLTEKGRKVLRDIEGW
ncbi:winged helix-turn-helix transcriptional regulator [Candidatus Micrarchaeota archaeon]|nr:winged helix-turn-helix transcriptional regulator [Candidatus Micrarchaeota archaeon]